MTKATKDIQISANIDPIQPDLCRMTVDRKVYDGSASFSTKDSAKGSPLAEKILKIEGISAVRVSGADVIITKDGPQQWRDLASKIAAVIRPQVLSGKPAVSKTYQKNRTPDKEITAKLTTLFAAEISPGLASHGGSVELVAVKNGDVHLRMGGGCQGCGMAKATMRMGIESAIRKTIPDVGEILDVTDHASGAKPYA